MCLQKISDAMKMTNTEVSSHVHKEIKPEVIENLLKFIEDNEKANVIDVLEQAIEEMSKELEARKDEPRPPKKKKSPAASSKSSNTEAKFRNLMKEIKDRIGNIRFTKDNF
jgi:ribosomal protein S7